MITGTHTDQKNIFEWTKEDEELDVKEEMILYPLVKSLLDLWKDNQGAGGRHWSALNLRLRSLTVAGLNIPNMYGPRSNFQERPS